MHGSGDLHRLCHFHDGVYRRSGAQVHRSGGLYRSSHFLDGRCGDVLVHGSGGVPLMIIRVKIL